MLNGGWLGPLLLWLPWLGMGNGRLQWRGWLNHNKPIIHQQLKWMVIYLAIGLAISFIIPFPFSLTAIMGILLFVSYYVRKRQLGGIGSSDSSSIFCESGYRSSNSLNYYCMNCGRRHNQFACPKCGSKMKRVGYWLSIQLFWRPYSVKASVQTTFPNQVKCSRLGLLMTVIKAQATCWVWVSCWTLEYYILIRLWIMQQPIQIS